MLVQFVRDVFIVVALLAALIAVSLPPVPDVEVAPRLKPSIDARPITSVTTNESVAIQPAPLSAAPAP